MKFYVYAIGPNEGPIKLGFTNNLETRLRAIQTGNPLPIKIHHYIEFDNEQNMRNAEKKIHETLRHIRKKGEWFDLSPENAKLELEFVLIHNYN